MKSRIMNGIERSAAKIGFVFCAALLGTVTGCTTYVEPRSPRAVYVPPPPVYTPPPPTVYVAPPPVYVPPPPAYVPPPPAYVPPPPAEVGISVGVAIRSENDFYEPLTPYGRWEVVGGYG